MAETERMTFAVPADLAEAVRHAVVQGEYASGSDVVREALRDWQAKRAALRADIERGLADVAAGRTTPFDADRIIERGKQRLAGRSHSA